MAAIINFLLLLCHKVGRDHPGNHQHCMFWHRSVRRGHPQTSSLLNRLHSFPTSFPGWAPQRRSHTRIERSMDYVTDIGTHRFQEVVIIPTFCTSLGKAIFSSFPEVPLMCFSSSNTWKLYQVLPFKSTYVLCWCISSRVLPQAASITNDLQ